MSRSESAAASENFPARRRIRGLDADERSAQRRRQLLAAATELFARQGFPATGIEQICQRANVGTKAFYDHFESKEACYIALLEQITRDSRQRVSEAAAHTATSWPQRRDTILTAFAHAIAADPHLAKVTFGEARGISPAVEAQHRANRQWAADFLEQQWRQQDSPVTEADRALALGVIGGMFELVAVWLQHHDARVTPEAVAELIEDLVHFVTAVDTGRLALAVGN